MEKRQSPDWSSKETIIHSTMDERRFLGMNGQADCRNSSFPTLSAGTSQQGQVRVRVGVVLSVPIVHACILTSDIGCEFWAQDPGDFRISLRRVRICDHRSKANTESVALALVLCGQYVRKILFHPAAGLPRLQTLAAASAGPIRYREFVNRSIDIGGEG